MWQPQAGGQVLAAAMLGAQTHDVAHVMRACCHCAASFNCMASNINSPSVFCRVACVSCEHVCLMHAGASHSGHQWNDSEWQHMCSQLLTHRSRAGRQHHRWGCQLPVIPPAHTHQPGSQRAHCSTVHRYCEQQGVHWRDSELWAELD